MSYVFHPDTEAELNQAIKWYEAREPGLALDFAARVYAAIQRALTYLHARQEIGGDNPARTGTSFSLCVLYIPERDLVLVIAVMHLHRQPDYWQDRKA